MSYFREFPNIQYVNRFPNSKSNDEITIAKNLFKRAKLREDFSAQIAAFDYYSIQENERPEQIAEKVYGDSNYDWVILLANNIINIYDEWPLDNVSFNNYLIEKYGSEESLQEVHHYETYELKDSFGRVVLPAGLIVDKSFYDAPEYREITSNPPGVNFPPIYLDGIVAIATASLGTGQNLRKVSSVSVLNNGRGYPKAPNVIFSPPPQTINGSASCNISNFRVSNVAITSTGKGYRSVPNVTFSAPPTSVRAEATCTITQNGSVQNQNITITNRGIGYGLTAPSVSFSFPPKITQGSTYKNNSSVTLGTQIDGMFVRNDGTRLFSASGTSSIIRSFNLGTAWDVNTLSTLTQLDVSVKFSYCTGIDFSSDGTKMFISGGKSGNFLIARYDLSTNWDVTSATYVSEYSLTSPGGIRFKSDGTRMYILHNQTSDLIKEYSLSSPWDITTSSEISTYNIESLTGDSTILGFTFNSLGTKLYVTGSDLSSIYEFNLSPWDLSTLSYQNSLYVGDRIANPSDVFVNPNIDNLLICGNNTNFLYEYRILSRTKATATVSNGSLNTISINTPGIGYTIPPTITIDNPFPQVTAIGTAVISNGELIQINITNSGFGYTVAPTVTVEPAPIFSSAVGIASVVNGELISIDVIDGGNNYDTPPSITFDLSPEPTLNVEVGDVYTQADKNWRWNGTKWEEQITDSFSFLDNGIVKTTIGNLISRPVSNYEYENKLNEDKRLIILPKPQYLPVIEDDFRKIMKYDRNADNVINSKTKSTYNPKLSGV